jgi:hypothetical protein
MGDHLNRANALYRSKNAAGKPARNRGP